MEAAVVAAASRGCCERSVLFAAVVPEHGSAQDNDHRPEHVVQGDLRHGMKRGDGRGAPTDEGRCAIHRTAPGPRITGAGADGPAGGISGMRPGRAAGLSRDAGSATSPGCGRHDGGWGGRRSRAAVAPGGRLEPWRRIRCPAGLCPPVASNRRGRGGRGRRGMGGRRRGWSGWTGCREGMVGCRRGRRSGGRRGGPRAARRPPTEQRRDFGRTARRRSSRRLGRCKPCRDEDVSVVELRRDRLRPRPRLPRAGRRRAGAGRGGSARGGRG